MVLVGEGDVEASFGVTSLLEIFDGLLIRNRACITLFVRNPHTKSSIRTKCSNGAVILRILTSFCATKFRCLVFADGIRFIFAKIRNLSKTHYRTKLFWLITKITPTTHFRTSKHTNKH